MGVEGPSPAGLKADIRIEYSENISRKNSVWDVVQAKLTNKIDYVIYMYLCKHQQTNLIPGTTSSSSSLVWDEVELV